MRIISSTGVSPVSTSDDNAVTVLAASNDLVRRITLYNSTANLGYWRLNTGAWAALPPNSVTHIVDDKTPISQPLVTVKRVASGGDITVHAYTSD